MDVDERGGIDQFANTLLRLRTRHELYGSFRERRLHADAAQRVEVELHLMAPAAADHRIEVREALRPETAAARERRRHAVARAAQPREPRATRVLGDTNDEIVVSCSARYE